MKTTYHSSSRRATPWSIKDSNIDTNLELIGIQKLIDETNQANFYSKHPLLKDSNDAYILNNYKLKHCKFCNRTHIQKDGFTNNGIHR